jgi:hypothetical protein
MTVLINGTNGLIQAYDYQTPTTGFSYTFAAGTQTLVMNPAGTLATGTITMPASPSDGMTITFSTTKQITALTLNGGAGQTIIGGINSMAPNQAVSFMYRLANTTWFPMTTQVAQGNGPAFSAQADGTQAITSSTYQKVLFATEAFDTNNNFASSRFTPTVAGYYQCNTAVSFAGGTTSETAVAVYKNGSLLRYPFDITTTTYYTLSGSFLISMNGSIDYLEIYVYQSSGTTRTIVTTTWFEGFLARAA